MKIRQDTAKALTRRAWICALLLAAPVVAQAPTPTGADPGTAARSPGAEATEARLRAAILLSPDVAAFRLSLADELERQGRTVDARTVLADAVRLDPDNAEYRARLGAAHLQLEEWLEAEANYDWAIRLAPGTAGLHEGLGDALLGQGRVPEATEAFGHAARLAPADARLAARAESVRHLGTSDVSGPLVRVLQGAIRVVTMLSAAFLTLAGFVLVLPIAGAILLIPLALLRNPRDLSRESKIPLSGGSFQEASATRGLPPPTASEPPIDPGSRTPREGRP